MSGKTPEDFRLREIDKTSTSNSPQARESARRRHERTEAMEKETKRLREESGQASDDERMQSIIHLLQKREKPIDNSEGVNSKINTHKEYKIRKIGKWSEAEVSSFINSYKTTGYLLDKDIETIRSRGGLSPQERSDITQIMYNEYKKQNNGEANRKENSRIYIYLNTYTEKVTKVTNTNKKIHSEKAK